MSGTAVAPGQRAALAALFVKAARAEDPLSAGVEARVRSRELDRAAGRADPAAALAALSRAADGRADRAAGASASARAVTLEAREAAQRGAAWARGGAGARAGAGAGAGAADGPPAEIGRAHV